jgi:signal transduction histidine kinase
MVISVSDSGPGIPDGEVDLIFDQFVQSSKTKTGAGGTGLGLAICRQIVNAHGGRIWAGNNEGGGACFTFTLNRHPQSPKKAWSLPLRTSANPGLPNVAEPENQPFSMDAIE